MLFNEKSLYVCIKQRNIMKNTVYAFLVLGSVVVGISCRQETAIIAPKQPTTVHSDLFTVENDQIVFKSAADFGQQIKSLTKLTEINLSKWNRSVDFTSLYEVREQQEKNETLLGARQSAAVSNDLSEVMEDPYFASLLNKDGEITIGELLIRVTADIVFVGKKTKNTNDNSETSDKIRKKDPSKYLYISKNKFVTDDGILVGRVYHLEQSARGARAAFNGITHSIYMWDDTHRSATVIYNDNWLVYRSLGCKVKFQNKRWWGGWIEQDTDALGLDFDVVYNVSKNPIVEDLRHVFVDSRFCSSCSLLSNTIDWSTLSIGIGADGANAELIDSPFDFKYFVANSMAASVGRQHYDSIRQDQ
jgi:hypothetical protein